MMAFIENKSPKNFVFYLAFPTLLFKLLRMQTGRSTSGWGSGHKSQIDQEDWWTPYSEKVYFALAICPPTFGLIAQWVKNLPAMQETQEIWVQSPGWKDPPEKGMATCSRILAWRIPWTEEPGGVLQCMGLQKSRT